MKPRYFALGAVLLGIVLVTSFFGAFHPTQAQFTGTNWTGQFFNNTTFSGNFQQVVYPSGLNFNWGFNAPTQADSVTPVPGIGADNFSARFDSTQIITQAGTYRFIVRVKDGVRVTINNIVYLDRLTATVPANQYVEYTFNADMFAGGNVMRVEYVHLVDNAVLQFQWGFVGAPGVGTSILTPGFGFPTSTPIPIATGSVITVKGLSVRSGPYLGASFITVARPDNAYEIVAKNFNEGLFPWYKIKINDSIGWVSGRYFSVSGNIDAVPVEDTVFEALNANNVGNIPPRLDVVGTTRAVMNMRVRPSERTQLILKIPWGGQVQVYGRTVQGFQNHWLFVRFEDQYGWIYAPFVGLRGVVDAVPIY